MAYEFLNLLDLAKSNGSDPVIGLIEDNLNSAPELQILPARAVKGTSFKTLVRLTYPSTGFRKANEGVETKKSTYDNRQFECFYYDGQMEIDNAVATADEQGLDHALAMEADGHGRAFLLTGGAQVWYGNKGTLTSGDTNGFQGACDFVDSSLLVNASGTTANTGSSVYAIVADPRFCQVILGQDSVFQVGDWRKQTVTRNSKEMTAWKNSLEGWIGMAFYSKYAVGRIKNLTADSGKGLTDSLLADLMGAFPVGVRPTHIVMNRRSRTQLQKSRTVTLNGNAQGNPKGGQATIAPVPTEYDGIPIIATDSITSAEPIV